MKINKTIFGTLFISSIFLFNCSSEKKTAQETKNYYYLFYQNYNEVTDTIPYRLGCKVDSGSIFKGAFHFRYKYDNSMHELRKYVYFDKIDSTSGTTSYTLDSLGVIYNKSNYYKSYATLSSNNDSINSLVKNSLGYIIIDDFK
jgi:hypothetical protein